MSLIYITGLSGSGKSTISAELKKRGFESHDADGEGFNNWYKNTTGKIATWRELKNINKAELHQKYSWKTSRTKVVKLTTEAKNKLVFLCGVSANEETVWDLFNKVICLVIDEPTLRNRIATRTSNDFGKVPLELEMILEWHKNYPGDYLKKGTTAVDANRPLNEVVDKILDICI